MQNAIVDFNGEKVDFVLQLGDLLDGQCEKYADRALGDLLDDWKKCDSKVLHVLGNHELYCFSKPESLNKFSLKR
jgi:hypothetical protein